MTENSDSSTYNWRSYTSKDGKLYSCDYSDPNTHMSTYKSTLEDCQNYYDSYYPIGQNSVDYGSLRFYKTTDKTNHNCWISNKVPCKLSEFTLTDGQTDYNLLVLPKTIIDTQPIGIDIKMFRKDFLSWVETKGYDYFDQSNISPRPYIFRTKLLLNANGAPPNKFSLDFEPYPSGGILQNDTTLKSIIENLSIYDKKILDNVVQLNDVTSSVTKPNEFCLNNPKLQCNYVEISTRPMNFKNTLLFYSNLPNKIDKNNINNFWTQIGQKDIDQKTDLTVDGNFAMSCTSENPTDPQASADYGMRKGQSNGFTRPNNDWNCLPPQSVSSEKVGSYTNSKSNTKSSNKMYACQVFNNSIDPKWGVSCVNTPDFQSCKNYAKITPNNKGNPIHFYGPECTKDPNAQQTCCQKDSHACMQYMILTGETPPSNIVVNNCDKTPQKFATSNITQQNIDADYSMGVRNLWGSDDNDDITSSVIFANGSKTPALLTEDHTINFDNAWVKYKDVWYKYQLDKETDYYFFPSDVNKEHLLTFVNEFDNGKYMKACCWNTWQGIPNRCGNSGLQNSEYISGPECPIWTSPNPCPSSSAPAPPPSILSENDYQPDYNVLNEISTVLNLQRNTETGPTYQCQVAMDSYCNGNNLNDPICGCYTPLNPTTQNLVDNYKNKGMDIPDVCVNTNCMKSGAFKNIDQQNVNCPMLASAMITGSSSNSDVNATININNSSINQTLDGNTISIQDKVPQIKYKCENNTCVKADDGTYFDASCGNTCNSESKYICKNSVCTLIPANQVLPSQTSYTSLKDCLADNCQSQYKWVCAKGTCSQNSDPSSPYSSLDDCEKSCKSIKEEYTSFTNLKLSKDSVVMIPLVILGITAIIIILIFIIVFIGKKMKK